MNRQLLFKIREFINAHPVIKNVLKALLSPFRSVTSSNYKILEKSDLDNITSSLIGAWKDPGIPALQWNGVSKVLNIYRAGEPVRNFDMLIEMLRPLINVGKTASLLEVGCSSGYYSEAFQIKSLDVEYTGCDFSDAFINHAQICYPNLKFFNADATCLPWSDKSYDFVLSGCCLLHIREWERAIEESARVSSQYVVFHRTPVCHIGNTLYFTKKAYGIDTLEIRFNEQEFLSKISRSGLRLLEIATLDVDWRGGDAWASKTYLCEKVDCA